MMAFASAKLCMWCILAFVSELTGHTVCVCLCFDLFTAWGKSIILHSA